MSEYPRVTQGRTCPKCKRLLAFAAFPGERGNDPKRRRCWECERADSRARGASEHGKELTRNRMRKFREQDRDRAREIGRMNYASHKSVALAYNRTRQGSLAWLARAKLNNELRAGHIHKPQACENCRTVAPPRRLHGHHHDYTKPLEVTWLCSLCHGLEHRV